VVPEDKATMGMIQEMAGASFPTPDPMQESFWKTT
jgi:hypothetical protein